MIRCRKNQPHGTMMRLHRPGCKTLVIHLRSSDSFARRRKNWRPFKENALCILSTYMSHGSLQSHLLHPHHDAQMESSTTCNPCPCGVGKAAWLGWKQPKLISGKDHVYRIRELSVAIFTIGRQMISDPLAEPALRFYDRHCLCIPSMLVWISIKNY